MDSLATIDEARALVSDRVLWPLVRKFLWDFSTQVHPSWLADVNTGGANLKAADGPRTRKWLLKELGVAPCYHNFPKGNPSRFLLLGGEKLLSIIKWLGALACADSLRVVTDGRKVRELKAALPGIYPEVFAFSAYFKGLGATAPGVASADGIAAEGAALLFSYLDGLSDPLKRRLLVMLPKPLSEVAPARSKPSDQIISKLIKLKFPEAHSLCC